MNAMTETIAEQEAPPAAANAVMKRATAEQIVEYRNKALELFGEAHASIAETSAKLQTANDMAAKASSSVTRYNFHNAGSKIKFRSSLRVPDREAYMAEARRIIDTDVWSHIIQITDLQRLMDKTAKDDLNQQLLKDPPEATVDNIMATLEQFMLDSGTIFRRGIATAFSGLDRRFRSHDGWKVGSRVILTRAFNESGSWCYYRNEADTISDIERTFRVLDDNPAATCEVKHEIDRARNGRYGRFQTEITTQYFKVRVFKNGNCHMWFTRDDLLKRVNQLLGEYYGAPIPEEREADADTGLNDPKTSLAKNYGFFPTPVSAADLLLKNVPLLNARENEPLSILEPSAGNGNLARRCFTAPQSQSAEEDCRPARWRNDFNESYRFDNQVDCVEIQKSLADGLTAEGRYRAVYNCDFLQLQPPTTGLYDRVVMNPPFDRERDIDHVMHALKFLKPSGFLTAIMSAGTEFRETRRSIAFRELMIGMRARFADLPPGSFSSVGTNCNTIMLRVWKDGRSFY